jgi:hypothetical protein
LLSWIIRSSWPILFMRSSSFLCWLRKRSS